MAASARDPLRVQPSFWQREEVTAALERRAIGRLFRLLRQYCGASQTRIGTAVGMTQSSVSLITTHDKPVTTIAVLERIADGLRMPDLARMRLGLAPKEVDIVRRRTALGLGLVGALSPSTLTGVLRESAAEALEFTRERAVSAVGTGTLEHLETAVAELHRSYDTRPAAELFPLARAYRLKVEQLIDGRHTLTEARELYLRAAHLSDLLSDLSHDLGSRLAADAYAIDAYRHADLAGHNEACAWASGSLATWSVYARRPDRAIAAAERGIAKAPKPSPIAARLHARAARGHALLGNRTACDDMLAKAVKMCDQLPDQSPARLRTESNANTAHLVASIAAHSHNLVGNHRAAEREARAALPVESWSPAEAGLARLHLGIALANLGSPDEAVEHGNRALASPGYLGSVRPLARELDAALTHRYPTQPNVADFHDRYQQLATQAITN